MQKGFSLLELLIYVALFSIVVVVLVSMVSTITRSRATANARFEVTENLRSVVEKIQQAIFDASFAETSGACPLNVVAVRTGSATTTFQIASGRLQMREGDANPFNDITSANVTAEGIDASTCLFTKISNPAPAKSTVQMKLKVRYNNQGRPEFMFSETTQLTMSLR